MRSKCECNSVDSGRCYQCFTDLTAQVRALEAERQGLREEIAIYRNADSMRAFVVDAMAAERDAALARVARLEDVLMDAVEDFRSIAATENHQNPNRTFLRACLVAFEAAWKAADKCEAALAVTRKPPTCHSHPTEFIEGCDYCEGNAEPVCPHCGSADCKQAGYDRPSKSMCEGMKVEAEFYADLEGDASPLAVNPEKVNTEPGIIKSVDFGLWSEPGWEQVRETAKRLADPSRCSTCGRERDENEVCSNPFHLPHNA
jgi:hypothetical protein